MSREPLTPFAGPAVGSVWRHVKSGGLYQVEMLARIEADAVPAVVYRELYGARFAWVRPVAEFLDGRFDPVRDASG